MNNLNQNVLAQNSSGEIAYICSKCAHEVDKEATVCPHCGVRLGDIKCPFCGFKGTVAEFKDDTCPKCGRKKNLTAKPLSPTLISKKTNHNITDTKTNYTPLIIIMLALSIISVAAFLKYFNIL